MRIRGLTTLKKLYGAIKTLVKKISFIGRQRYCPICRRFSRKFDSYGVDPQPDALCIHCKSLERHRLIWLFFQTNTDLFNNPSITMLHIAPEPCMEKKLKKLLGNGYITADLCRENVRIKMDITDIPLSDNAFDTIFCSHVLEHVPDDRKALREFFRVLKPSGWLLLVVPVNVDKTIEDPSITDPQKRLELFGQEDHVRKYGPDIIERIQEAGFKVKSILPGDFLSQEQIRKCSTSADSPLYCCTKQ